MILQPVAVIDGNRFTRSDDGNTYVAEMSDFGSLADQLRGGGLQFHQIYDDACDVGIAIRVPKTGVIVWFYEALVQRDREYDIQWWEFVPITEHVRKYPALANVKVRIYND